MFTEESLIDLFIAQARRHLAIKWADQGSPEFNFTAMQDIETPLFYIQTINATETANRSTYQFTMYCLDTPATSTETDNSAFEWDSRFVASRDACKAALNDIICEVKVQNLQLLTIENTGSLVPDGDVSDNFVGWRQSVNVSFDTRYASTNFPTE